MAHVADADASALTLNPNPDPNPNPALTPAGQAGVDHRAGAADLDLRRQASLPRGQGAVRPSPSITRTRSPYNPLNPSPRIPTPQPGPPTSPLTLTPPSPLTRHDPCVLPRTPPLIEGMAALVLIDAALLQRTRLGGSATTVCDGSVPFAPWETPAPAEGGGKKARRA
jgi:hypothetical protein